MANLVAKVPKNRAVGLVQPFTDLFALRVVRFIDVQRDDPISVPGHVFRQPQHAENPLIKSASGSTSFEITGRPRKSREDTSRPALRSQFSASSLHWNRRRDPEWSDSIGRKRTAH